MLGYLRFILAILVLLSHINIRVYGLNPGVFAVVIFYILAGHVVAFLYQDIYKKNLKLFYLDRIKRIFPAYTVVAIITILFLLITNYGSPIFTLKKLIYNFTIIPLNYYMYIDVNILQKPAWNLIPPAWSLGTELQAYLIIPLAIAFIPLRYSLYIISLIIYLLANFSLLQPDYFGYRLIAGVFFIFYTGVLIKNREKKDIMLLIVTYILVSLQFFYSIYTNKFNSAYQKETILALLIGIPLIYVITTINKPNSLLSKFAGKISYPLFLSHFLAIWIFNYFHYTNNLDYYIYIIISISLIIAYFVTLCEAFINQKL